MNLLPVHWRRNGLPARMDIADRYLAHLRWNLMNIPAPHIVREYSPAGQAEIRKVLTGNARMQAAITMIGEVRLEQLETAVRNILRQKVPGDFLEAGAWRGGACIYLRALLDVHGCRDRIVYGCDAFDDGFPKPDPRFPIDDQSTLHTREYFKTSNVVVRNYFKYYGYDDDQVRFVCGYFQDTLPKVPADQIALLRLDGDLYSSTWDSLEALYDRVPVGGYVIADDYYAIVNSQRAIDDFRTSRRITEPIHQVDWASVYWIKERE